MADPNQERRWKEEFVRRMLQIEEHDKGENHYNVMTKESYDKLVDEIEEAQSAEKKTQKQYRRLNRYKVVNICGTRKLATRKEPLKYYLRVDEIFDIVEAVHQAVGHGGRDRLKVETSRKYANITVEMINIYLSICETCQSKRSIKKMGHLSKPTLHSEMNSRCQVDLIDMQTQEDRGFKYTIVYQDQVTKFVLLCALQSRRAEEVAHHLADIFLPYGAPCNLHSDNGREFVNYVKKQAGCILA
ncbi:KRAB-A domain-containing protein 2-like [Schistocerca americana]|uniref:KRAB-A domain-containing protein 2-like n=1 Tax=Schistocerca americana TaxID=7009 RepID=UPI001F4F7E77|nr:KRAB-A domain-containing protein 2-like [Schistocerca americana]